MLAAVTFDQGYASPLRRAQHTAQIIWQDRPTPLISLPELIEIDLPPWQGMTPQEVARQFPERFVVYRQTPAHFELEGRYPVVELWAQARSAWEQILKSPGHCLLVVAHNAINQALLSTALGLGPASFRILAQGNGGISVLNFQDDGQAQLESLNQTAHLTPPLPPKKAPSRVLLVRHGETQWNREGRFQGQMDIPLNATGFAQAQGTAELLKDIAIDRVISSPLQRPFQTAETIVAPHPALALTTLADLQEISHGTWEGKLHTQVEAEYPGMLAQWNQHPETVQMPEGEDLNAVWERTRRAWSQILDGAEDKTTLVVAHDAINKAILCLLTDLGPAAFWRFKQGNGAVTVIDYPDGVQGRGVLTTVNYTGHLGSSVFDCTAEGAL